MLNITSALADFYMYNNRNDLPTLSSLKQVKFKVEVSQCLSCPSVESAFRSCEGLLQFLSHLISTKKDRETFLSRSVFFLEKKG